MTLNNINRIFLGNEEIVKAYLGSEQIYSNAVPFHAQFDLSKGTSSTTLTLPFNTEDSYSNLTIDWGDGTETTGTNTHTYDTIGEYDVKIYGEVRDFRYNNVNNPQKLMRIIHWGQFIITTDYVFSGCSNLIIEDLETKINVETNDMTNMFYGCKALTSIPDLDTSNVTNMRSIFSGCSQLIEIPDLDTSNVTNMAYMFQNCSALTSIPLLDTSSVINMSNMFDGCSLLTSITVSDTSSVTTMSYMFSGCSQLTSITLSDTSNVTNMSYMFQNCSALTSIPDLDTSSVTNMRSMFRECSALTTIPLLDTSNIINMSNMFQNCSSLTSIPDLDTSNVTNMAYMFDSCSSLTSLTLIDTSKVTNMLQMLRNCTVLDVDLSGWCVPLIASLPPLFVTGSPLMTEEKLPVWGTCP